MPNMNPNPMPMPSQKEAAMLLRQANTSSRMVMMAKATIKRTKMPMAL